MYYCFECTLFKSIILHSRNLFVPPIFLLPLHLGISLASQNPLNAVSSTEATGISLKLFTKTAFFSITIWAIFRSNLIVLHQNVNLYKSLIIVVSYYTKIYFVHNVPIHYLYWRVFSPLLLWRTVLKHMFIEIKKNCNRPFIIYYCSYVL